MRRRVERLEGRVDPASGHAHGVLAGELNREFEAFVEALVDEVVAEAARIREQRDRGEREGHDALPLDGKPWRDLVALAVSYGSLQRVPLDVLEALGVAPGPEEAMEGRPREVEELDTEFHRYVLAEALERDVPAGWRSD